MNLFDLVIVDGLMLSLLGAAIAGAITIFVDSMTI